MNMEEPARSVITNAYVTHAQRNGHYLLVDAVEIMWGRRHLAVAPGTVDFFFNVEVPVCSLVVEPAKPGQRQTVVYFEHLTIICESYNSGGIRNPLSAKNILGTLIGTEKSVLKLWTVGGDFSATRLVSNEVSLRKGMLSVAKGGEILYVQGEGRIIGPPKGTKEKLVIGRVDSGIAVDADSNVEIRGPGMRLGPSTERTARTQRSLRR
jgi:hypothetical protein